MSGWRLSFSNSSARLSLLIALAWLLLLPGSLLAQSYRGSIRGHVVDPSGGVMAGAKVTAKNGATGFTRETVTGGDGAYVLAELAAGKYVVMAQAPNLNPVAQNVTVNVGLDTTADFDLTQVERRQEQVTVSSEPPLVESTRDVLGEVVDQQLVTELPLNGRDFGKLVARRPARPSNLLVWLAPSSDLDSSTSTAIATAPTITAWTGLTITIPTSIIRR